MEKNILGMVQVGAPYLEVFFAVLLLEQIAAKMKILHNSNLERRMLCSAHCAMLRYWILTSKVLLLHLVTCLYMKAPITTLKCYKSTKKIVGKLQCLVLLTVHALGLTRMSYLSMNTN